jgi:primosomal protein N' (replication factor Y)
LITYHFAQIIVKGIENELTYFIPPSLKDLDIGFEVQVEVRKRLERGWVVGLTNEVPQVKESSSNNNLNQINLFEETIDTKVKVKEIYSAHLAFSKEDLPFFKLVSSYYSCPLYEVFENAVPKKVDERLKFGINLSKDSVNLSLEDLLNLVPKNAKSQKTFLENLKTNNATLNFDDINDLSQDKRRAITALLEKGIIEKNSGFTQNEKEYLTEPTPNLDQKNAIDKIAESLKEKKYSPFILFGITGSGKTEVYIKSIEEAIKDGGSALLIVPEIALTPQTISRLNARLAFEVAVLHSQIGSGTKWSEWVKILNSEKRIIVGARSAIFAPIKDLRLIIVDEEHESSYKQAEGLRYNARDLALIKAKDKNCSVILGSATPSFESIANAAKKNFKLLELNERATKANLPEIKVVDLTGLRKSYYASPNISNTLFEEIKIALDRNEQIILFYNKRGFASFLQCTSCGTAIECPECSVTLTYYQNKNKLSCHYCGQTSKAPDRCPKCSDPELYEINEEKKTKKFGKLVPRGSGTEKVYDEIKELFPGVAIDRMDRESTTKKDSIENILNKMQTGETKILVGTQMLAKGHDLPSVTLVGIIDADVGLHFPDFRSSERTFQLIVQASGRAGRGNLPGKVVIQTREANHPTIVAAVTNRFKAFVRYELEYRKKLDYPPESRLARIIISSPDLQEAATASRNLIAFLENLKDSSNEINNFEEIKILGPSPAPIEKLRGRYRWHILIKSRSAKNLSQVAKHIKTWKDKIKASVDLRVIVDIDPIDMM